MRESLGHWFRISKQNEIDLWTNGLFSFDASVLLNIYGYSKETRSDLISLIQGQSARVCLPHQFGLEFARNRAKVIIKQVNNHGAADSALEEFQKNHIAPKREHPHLSASAQAALKRVRSELIAGKKEMERMISSDEFADTLLTTFDGHLGSQPDADALDALHDVARDRYEKKIPPGFADLKEKGAPDGYGDYVGWTQLIDIAKQQNRGVIFVTDDLKEDWWFIERERMVGPRAELIKEFKELSGQTFWMYSSENFLRSAKKFLNVKIADAAIEEVTIRLRTAESETFNRLVRHLKVNFAQIGLTPSPDKPAPEIPNSQEITTGESGKPASAPERKDGEG
jgi:hypothetical protein